MGERLVVWSVVAVAAVAVSWCGTAQASPEDPYGSDWVAVAVAPTVSGSASYGGGGNPDDAIKIAMDECGARSAGARCVLAEVMEYGCVAEVVNNKTQAWAGGRGPTVEAATADASTQLPPFELGDVTGGGWCSTPLTPP